MDAIIQLLFTIYKVIGQCFTHKEDLREILNGKDAEQSEKEIN
jgi:hypothetical protein